MSLFQKLKKIKKDFTFNLIIKNNSYAKNIIKGFVKKIAKIYYNNAPKNINYFSLDVEGAEERIISDFDFTKYQFDCLTIERPTPKCNEILFANDYVFVKNSWMDSFYVHRTIAASSQLVCAKFEQVPPKDW